jgi:hypothetical protein
MNQYMWVGLALLVWGCGMSFYSATHQTTWSKQIDIHIPDKNGWVILAEQNIEFGLRQDGVVVWRKIQK